MRTPSFSKDRWKKNWAGDWSLFSTSIFGFEYTKVTWDALGTGLSHALLLWDGAHSRCLFVEKDLERFGKAVARKAARNPRFLVKLAGDLTASADRFMVFLKARRARTTDADFRRFLRLSDEYIVCHVPLKWVVNFLPPRVLAQRFKVLEAARVHAEPVYKYTETFTLGYLGDLAARTGYRVRNLKQLTLDELRSYWKNGKLPAASILSSRGRGSALLFSKGGKYRILTKTETQAAEKAIARTFAESAELTGTGAYPGKVRGTVRIVRDPKKPGVFKAGDILVAAMTRPEYLPLMEKAAGFITDAGGMLCHAAITAREMKKPCLVGTEVATARLKSGQTVELDADRGVARTIPLGPQKKKRR